MLSTCSAPSCGDHPEPVKHRGILPYGQLTSSRDKRAERLRDPGRAVNNGRLLSEIDQCVLEMTWQDVVIGDAPDGIDEQRFERMTRTGEKALPRFEYPSLRITPGLEEVRFELESPGRLHASQAFGAPPLPPLVGDGSDTCRLLPPGLKNPSCFTFDLALDGGQQPLHEPMRSHRLSVPRGSAPPVAASPPGRTPRPPDPPRPSSCAIYPPGLRIIITAITKPRMTMVSGIATSNTAIADQLRLLRQHPGNGGAYPRLGPCRAYGGYRNRDRCGQV